MNNIVNTIKKNILCMLKFIFIINLLFFCYNCRPIFCMYNFCVLLNSEGAIRKMCTLLTMAVGLLS